MVRMRRRSHRDLTSPRQRHRLSTRLLAGRMCGLIRTPRLRLKWSLQHLIRKVLLHGLRDWVSSSWCAPGWQVAGVGAGAVLGGGEFGVVADGGGHGGRGARRYGPGLG